MDRDRYKRREQVAPQKRSINNEERPLHVAPVIPTSPASAQLPPEPKQDVPSQPLSYKTQAPKEAHPQPVALLHHTPQAQSASSAPSANPAKPLLFDEEDEDIFGVWQNQKQIKKAQKAERLAAKEAKKTSKQAKKQAAKLAKEQGKPHEIAIKLSVPRTSKLKLGVKRGYKKEYKKYYIAGATLVALPIIAISIGFVIQTQNKQGGETAVLGQTAVAAKPDFATIKPTTTDNQATPLKYEADKKLASYNDVLNNTPITVSQQLLPSEFKANPTTSVENLAKQMNANDKISASDATAFAGVSIKGPQTVVFTKNDLLIFIIADKKIDVLTWSKYIESMR